MSGKAPTNLKGVHFKVEYEVMQDLLHDITTAINTLEAAFNAHCAESYGHEAVDTTVTSGAIPTTSATAKSLAAEILTLYEAHRASTTYHVAADATNTISGASGIARATAISGAYYIANDIKTQFNAHLTEAGKHKGNDVTNTVAATNATTLETLIALLTEIKADYDLHINQIAPHDDVADTNNVVTASDLPTKTS